MMRILGYIMLVGCGSFVVYVEGPHWFALWNILPLLLAGLVLHRGAVKGRKGGAEFVFVLLTTICIALPHAAWKADWGRTATGASTSALIFVFSPIYSLLIAICGWSLVKVIEKLNGHSVESDSFADSNNHGRC